MVRLLKCGVASRLDCRWRGGLCLFLLFLTSIFSSMLTGTEWGDGRHGDYAVFGTERIEDIFEAVRLHGDPEVYDPYDSAAIPSFRNLTIESEGALTGRSRRSSGTGYVRFNVTETLIVRPSGAVSADGFRWLWTNEAAYPWAYDPGKNQWFSL